MGQIKVVNSGDKRTPFNKLQIGEVFRIVSETGFTYLKVSKDQTFCFECFSMEVMFSPDLFVYPVNATLTVKE